MDGDDEAAAGPAAAQSAGPAPVPGSAVPAAQAAQPSPPSPDELAAQLRSAVDILFGPGSEARASRAAARSATEKGFRGLPACLGTREDWEAVRAHA
jgi:hypothetical protein